jgi:hypothetical protein
MDSVALLERTRTVGSGGQELQTFTDDTRPTADEVEGLIDVATEAVLSQLPIRLAPAYYERTKHMVALYTAVLIEASYFREQLDQGSVALYRQMLTDGMGALLEATGGEAGEGVKSIDSVIQIGIAAEYDPLRLLDRPLPASPVPVLPPGTPIGHDDGGYYIDV